MILNKYFLENYSSAKSEMYSTKHCKQTIRNTTPCHRPSWYTTPKHILHSFTRKLADFKLHPVTLQTITVIVRRRSQSSRCRAAKLNSPHSLSSSWALPVSWLLQMQRSSVSIHHSLRLSSSSIDHNSQRARRYVNAMQSSSHCNVASFASDSKWKISFNDLEAPASASPWAWRHSNFEIRFDPPLIQYVGGVEKHLVWIW